MDCRLQSRNPESTRRNQPNPIEDHDESSAAKYEEDINGLFQDDTKWAKTNTSQGRRLACPFFKYNRTRHWNCNRASFQTWAYVKQHLKRKHYCGGYFCPRCNIRFKTPIARDQHGTTCGTTRLPLDEQALDKITDDKLDFIEKETRHRRHSALERWNIAWSIIFPTTTPPVPYVQDPRIDVDEHFVRVLCSLPSSFGHAVVNDNLVTSTASWHTILERIIDHFQTVSSLACNVVPGHMPRLARNEIIHASDAHVKNTSNQAAETGFINDVAWYGESAFASHADASQEPQDSTASTVAEAFGELDDESFFSRVQSLGRYDIDDVVKL